EPAVPSLTNDSVDARAAGQLRSLMTISTAVGASHRFEELLELIADEACSTLSAASLSISRLDGPARRLQTLVNVGRLGPGEERRPSAEFYQLADFPEVLVSLQAGYPYLAAVDDPDTDPAERDLLRALGKDAAVTIPIMCEQGLWGELWATTAPGSPRFTWEDLSFLFAVTGHVAAAIAHAERLGRLSDYAYTDELTGLFNRRKLHEELARMLAVNSGEAAADVALVMCDIEGLKSVSDTFGHEAGDRVLMKVADGLRAVTAGVKDALVCRLGGDEFCLLLPGQDAEQARTLAQMASDRLASLQPDPITISCGVAAGRAGALLPDHLLRSADAAQYQAKQTRPGSVVVAGDGPGGHTTVPLRRTVRDRAEPLAGLLDHTLHRLDTSAGAGPADRLGIVAAEFAARVGADAWAVAQGIGGERAMRTAQTWCADADHRALRAGAAQLTVAPTSERLHSALVESQTARLLLPDDPDWPVAPASGWPAAMLLAGARSDDGGWLVGLDVLEPDSVTRAITAAVRLLVCEAVRAAGTQTAHGLG
ncbi:MAG TPA: sensor domain-containing diguanylate cyclase, partial [Egibacteraceae bacterium]|nr:sensor domain-containing diguanylate cyclase [Egibacteraceae bacterium]